MLLRSLICFLQTMISFFFIANQEEVLEILNILHLYQSASAQLINSNKSEFSLSQNVLEERENDVQSWMQIKAVEGHSQYLGLPTFASKSKKHVFEFVKDRVWKKLKGWKEHLLSSARMEVLIKAIAQAIPTYIMGCFQLPSSLCDQIRV